MLEITNGSQKLRFYCQILQYPTRITVSRGRCSAVNSVLTFHRVTILRIGHRKLQRGFHLESKTLSVFFFNQMSRIFFFHEFQDKLLILFIFFFIYYQISRILSRILKPWVYYSSKTLRVVGKSSGFEIQLFPISN